MDMATVIGIVSFFTLILLGMGNVGFFIDVPSLLIVCGGTTALTLVSFPLHDVVSFFAYIRHAFFPPQADADRDQAMREMEKGILMLGRIKTSAQATGWLGVLIGAIIILGHMDDPAMIGPGAAMMLLTALYGIIIAYGLCAPIATKLEVYRDELEGSGSGAEHALADPAEEQESAKPLSGCLVTIGVVFGIVVLVVIMGAIVGTGVEIDNNTGRATIEVECHMTSAMLAHEILEAVYDISTDEEGLKTLKIELEFDRSCVRDRYGNHSEGSETGTLVWQEADLEEVRRYRAEDLYLDDSEVVSKVEAQIATMSFSEHLAE